MTTEQRIQLKSFTGRGSDWAAALLILTSKYLADDARVWRHVDLEHASIYFAKMLKDGTFSSGEKNLIRIAASLFSTDVEVNLWRAFGYLDEEATAIALRAIGVYCGREVKVS